MENLLARASALASMAHYGQTITGTDTPYVAHAALVAGLVQAVTDDENMVAAAWLHDTLEDTEMTYQDLVDETNQNVADYVQALTDQSAEGNRKTRKTAERKRLSAEGAEVQTIKLADIVANLTSPGKLPLDFKRVYLEEKRALSFALTQGDERLRSQAQRLVWASV